MTTTLTRHTRSYCNTGFTTCMEYRSESDMRNKRKGFPICLSGDYITIILTGCCMLLTHTNYSLFCVAEIMTAVYLVKRHDSISSATYCAITPNHTLLQLNDPPPPRIEPNCAWCSRLSGPAVHPPKWGLSVLMEALLSHSK